MSNRAIQAKKNHSGEMMYCIVSRSTNPALHTGLFRIERRKSTEETASTSIDLASYEAS